MRDPRVGSADVRVSTEFAFATLDGEVPALASPKAADEISGGTSGVRSVLNRLVVRRSGRTDRQPSDAGNAALRRAPAIARSVRGVRDDRNLLITSGR